MIAEVFISEVYTCVFYSESYDVCKPIVLCLHGYLKEKVEIH